MAADRKSLFLAGEEFGINSAHSAGQLVARLAADIAEKKAELERRCSVIFKSKRASI